MLGTAGLFASGSGLYGTLAGTAPPTGAPFKIILLAEILNVLPKVGLVLIGASLLVRFRHTETLVVSIFVFSLASSLYTWFIVYPNIPALSENPVGFDEVYRRTIIMTVIAAGLYVALFSYVRRRRVEFKGADDAS